MAKPALFGKPIEVFYLIQDLPEGFASTEWQIHAMEIPLNTRPTLRPNGIKIAVCVLICVLIAARTS
jgi:hypothetical protein